MIVPMLPILQAAARGGYAQGAFNVTSVPQAKAAIEAQELLHSPAILQAADLANGFMGGRTDFANATMDEKRRGFENIAAAVRRFGENSPIPIALHLDHGHDFESCRAAIESGYTSVMIDGSALPFEENVELTRQVTEYAHARGVTVEGELGVLAGTEDEVSSERSSYTSPVQAVEFFRRTRIDALAISYGTMHGANKGANARLRKEIAVATREGLLREGVEGYLVSHGSSTVPRYVVKELNRLGGRVQGAQGIPLEELLAAIPCGINKINVDTDIRLAVTRNLRELFAAQPSLRQAPPTAQVWALLQRQPEAFDPRLFLAPLMDMVMYGHIESPEAQAVADCIERGAREIICTLVVQFGSYGRAGEVEQLTLEQARARYAGG